MALRYQCYIARADVLSVWGVTEVNVEVDTVGEWTDEKKYSDL